ncbi:MAG: hypothetical protein VB934_13220 [Polyangiaceae bacterium]
MIWVLVLPSLLLPTVVLSDDVELELAPTSDFVVEDSSGDEILRVEEDTRKVLAEKAVFAPPGLISGSGALASVFATRNDVSAEICIGSSNPYSCCTGVATGTCNWSVPMIISGDDTYNTPLFCWTHHKADTPGQQLYCVAEGSQIQISTSIAVDGDGRWLLDSNLLPQRTVAFGTRFPPNMISARSDTRGAMVLAPNEGTMVGKFGLWIEDEDEGVALVTGKDGKLLFCDTTDLAAGLTSDTATATFIASAGTPYVSVEPGDFVAINEACGGASPCTTAPTQNAGLYEVATIGGGGNSLTMTEVFDVNETNVEAEVFRCSDWLVAGSSGGIELGANTVFDTSSAAALRVPNGADCPAVCSPGDVFMDTNTSTDTNCVSSFDGAVCGCHSVDSWGCP